MLNEEGSFKLEYTNVKRKDIKVFWSKNESSNENNSNDKCLKNDLKYFHWQTKPSIENIISNSNYFSIQNFSKQLYSIAVDNKLESPSLICFICNSPIKEEDEIIFEDGLVFTNKNCWKNWIENMVKSNNFEINNLWSEEAKKYFLSFISRSCNGSNIIKVLLIFKGIVDEEEFAKILNSDRIFFDHYLAFLRETRQTKEILFWSLDKLEEKIRNFRRIMYKYISADLDSVNYFMKELKELLDEIKSNEDLNYLPLKMINEYLNLLNWQAINEQDLINQPLVETIIKSKLSYQAMKDENLVNYLRDNFKMDYQEFFWTCLISINKNEDFEELQKALQMKGFPGKSNIDYERILAVLVSINKSADDLKMKCLLKISNIKEMIDCANLYDLLKPLLKYCKIHEEGYWKKIQNALPSYQK